MFWFLFLSLTVQIDLPLKLYIKLSVGKRTKSAGDQIFFFPLYSPPIIYIHNLYPEIHKNIYAG